MVGNALYSHQFMHHSSARNPNRLPLSEIISALRTGAITSASLIEESLDRHETVREQWQPYKSFDRALTRKQADLADKAFARGQDKGPLQGIPISVKDIYCVEGYPTFAGSPAEIPTTVVSQGSLVNQLRAQHGVITGKTHTVEFAFGGLGTNPHWGAPRNPWDARRHRVAGGSSAGAGVSLWCGAYVAMGTDTAGSVRIPASMTGNVGLKTSYGRWPTDGIVPLSPSLDTAGILTRCVADAAIAFEAIDPLAAEVSRNADISALTIGVPDTFFWEDCSPGIAENVEKAIREIEQAGATIVPLDIPEVFPAIEIFKQGHLAAPELYEFLSSCLPEWLKTLNRQVSARVDAAKDLSAHEYLWRARKLNELAASAANALKGVDLVITPTVAISPPVAAELDANERYGICNMLALRNTCVVNLLQLCAISLPVGLDNLGLPVGMQLIAPAGRDAQLLAMALSIEHLLGDSHQRLGVFSTALGASI